MTRKWKTRENMTTWSGKRGLPPVWFSWLRFLNLAVPTISEPGAWLPHWRSFCCSEPILWEFNSSVLMLRLSFVPMNLHNCWPRDWKGSWTGMLRSEIETLALIASRGNTAFLFYRISHSTYWFPNSLIWIPDSKAQGSRFHKQKFPGIGNRELHGGTKWHVVFLTARVYWGSRG